MFFKNLAVSDKLSTGNTLISELPCQPPAVGERLDRLSKRILHFRGVESKCDRITRPIPEEAEDARSFPALEPRYNEGDSLDQKFQVSPDGFQLQQTKLRSWTWRGTRYDTSNLEVGDEVQIFSKSFNAVVWATIVKVDKGNSTVILEYDVPHGDQRFRCQKTVQLCQLTRVEGDSGITPQFWWAGSQSVLSRVLAVFGWSTEDTQDRETGQTLVSELINDASGHRPCCK